MTLSDYCFRNCSVAACFVVATRARRCGKILACHFQSAGMKQGNPPPRICLLLGRRDRRVPRLKFHLSGATMWQRCKEFEQTSNELKSRVRPIAAKPQCIDNLCSKGRAIVELRHNESVGPRTPSPACPTGSTRIRKTTRASSVVCSRDRTGTMTGLLWLVVMLAASLSDTPSAPPISCLSTPRYYASPSWLRKRHIALTIWVAAKLKCRSTLHPNGQV